MCGSEELIHDARQVDLEEMIMTNETPMYLVPGRLTDEQDTVIRRNMIGGPILDPADIFALLVRTIGTPIQPCAGVEIAAIKALLRPLLTRLDYAAHELEQTEHAQSVHQMAHICLSLLSDEAAIRESAFRELAALNEGAAG